MAIFAPEPASFSTAWHHSLAFCTQTLDASARHPLLVFLCGAIPAAERGYVLLKRGATRHQRLLALEAVVILSRILLVVAAVWIALNPSEQEQVKRNLVNTTQWQLGLQHVGAHLGNHLHVVLWEYALFAAGCLLVNLLIVMVVRALSKRAPADRQRAYISIVRNLVLIPLAVIYLVETLRPMFR